MSSLICGDDTRNGKRNGENVKIRKSVHWWKVVNIMETLFSIVATILFGVILVPLVVMSLLVAIEFSIDVMIDIWEMWSEWRER